MKGRLPSVVHSSSPQIVTRRYLRDRADKGFIVIQTVIVSEFGGISHTPTRGERWFGHDTVPDTAAYLARYQEHIGAILDCPTIFGFCHPQFTDTAQEANGLLTADRCHKLDPDTIRAINTAPSLAVPAEVIQQVRRKVGVMRS